ncbi:hypothetical protein SAMN04487895_104206 [Paenibacillus sophorae]|uniref:Uncharacterized protein n=1 Tax=Paenibacillus sophorae TaxID=1333845 RepID=A0A1H8L6X7_9BACL|nr:hypothetical protein [Paenibacillus sophorae]QWU17408.1 hypothetical protein KP014_09770 [Paenibacillus sophorae]SEO00863.1 hypothetical protein SAMN04487895_104206 [Paenibacillus sophorae]
MLINYLLIVLYIVAIGCSLYIIHRHKAYFHERFRKGTISIFMLAMLFFLAAYTFKMVIVLLFRAAAVFGFGSPRLAEWLLYGWTLAQMGTTAGLIALAWLTFTGKYDQFMVLRRMDKKIEEDYDNAST